MDTYAAAKEVPEMNDIDRLRRLAFNLAAADAHPPTDDWLETSLDPKTLALVRLGAVVAMGGGAVASVWRAHRRCAGRRSERRAMSSTCCSGCCRSSAPRASWPRLRLSRWRLGHDTDDIPGAERSEQ